VRDEKDKSMTKNYKFFLILVISLGLIVRFVSLGQMSFWSDELLTLNFADEAKSTGRIVYENLTYPDQSPPLFTLLLHMWMKIFGRDDGGLRTLPALISFLTLLALLRLFGSICPVRNNQEAMQDGRIANGMGKRLSLILITMFSFSGYYLYLGRELRPYGLLLLLAALNHYYFLKAASAAPLEKKSPTAPVRSPGVIYSLTLFTGVLVNPFMWLVFISQIFYLWIIRERLKAVKIIKLSIPAVILYLPYLLIIGRQFRIYKSFPVFSRFMLQKFAGLFLHLTTGFKITSNITPESYGYLFTDIWFIPCLVLTGIMLFGIAGMGFKKKLRDRTNLFCFINIVIPVLIVTLVYPRRLGPRTLCIIAPFYHYLAIKGMGLFLKKRGYVAVIALFLFINILSGCNLIMSPVNPYIPEDWKSLVRNVEGEGRYLIATKNELELVRYYADNTNRFIEYDPRGDVIESRAHIKKSLERRGAYSAGFLLREVRPYPLSEPPARELSNKLFDIGRFEGIENYGRRLKILKFKIKGRDHES
jgi:uncharacterized membrane protein